MSNKFRSFENMPLLIEKDYLDQSSSFLADHIENKSPQVQQLQIQETAKINEQLEEEAFDQDILSLQSGFIQLRDEKIKQVATDMNTVRDLFHDLSYMIDEQREPIESIVDEIDKTNHYVHEGVKELDKANIYHKKKRKRLCGLGIFGVVIGAIIITTISVVKKVTPG